MSLQKQLRHKSKKLTESARNQMCTVRIPRVCNFRPDTTVFAHLNGGGMGTKKSDLFGAFCCSSCHDVIDGRVPSEFNIHQIMLMHYAGMERTQQWWLDNGYLELP